MLHFCCLLMSIVLLQCFRMKCEPRYIVTKSETSAKYLIRISKKKLNYTLESFFFFFRPFPLVRGGHSVSSFSTSFCLQCPSPSHQLPPYLLLLYLKIFSLVSLFSYFLVTPFPSSFFLHTASLSS